ALDMLFCNRIEITSPAGTTIGSFPGISLPRKVFESLLAFVAEGLFGSLLAACGLPAICEPQPATRAAVSASARINLHLVFMLGSFPELNIERCRYPAKLFSLFSTA